MIPPQLVCLLSRIKKSPCVGLAVSKPPRIKAQEDYDYFKSITQRFNCHHLKQGNGLNEVLEFKLKTMTNTEGSLHMENADDNKANGYRHGKVYRHVKLPELRIPSDRNGEFYPKVSSSFAHPAGRDRQAGERLICVWTHPKP